MRNIICPLDNRQDEIIEAIVAQKMYVLSNFDVGGLKNKCEEINLLKRIYKINTLMNFSKVGTTILG